MKIGNRYRIIDPRPMALPDEFQGMVATITGIHPSSDRADDDFEGFSIDLGASPEGSYILIPENVDHGFIELVGGII